MKVAVQKLGPKPGFVQAIEASSLRIETEHGLVLSVIDRGEGGLDVKLDPQWGRLEIHELYATDSQARLKAAAVNAPSGETMASLTEKLQAIEWVDDLDPAATPDHELHCPVCRRGRLQRHTDGCWLGAFLGQASSFLPDGR